VEVLWTSATDGDGSPRLLKRGTAPLPPNVWNDIAAHHDAFAAAIQAALNSAGITAKSVVACMPRRLVTLRFARLPHAPPEQLRGMVMFEAQQYILFSLDEVILDYQVVSEPFGMGMASEDDMETVLLAAVRRSTIAALMSVFDRAGLELQQLSVSALALAEHARSALEPTALIDLEPGEMDVAVVSDGQLLFTRATALDVHGPRPEVAARRLAEEVARSFTAYQNEFRQKPLAHVYLGGSAESGAEAEQLETTLSEMLEMPVTRLQSRLLPPSDPDVRAYATAIGMALQTQKGSLAPINLVPNERAERRVQQIQRQRQTVAAIVAAAAVILLIAFLRTSLARQADLRRRTLQANNDLSGAVSRLDARKKQFDRVQTLNTEVTRSLNHDHPVVDVMVALTRALPKSNALWLTQFTFERGGLITLHGETKAQTAATDLMLALQQSGAFTDVRLGYLGDSQSSEGGETGSAAPPNGPAPAAASGSANAAPSGPAAPSAPITPLPGLPGLAAPGGTRAAAAAAPPPGNGNRPSGSPAGANPTPNVPRLAPNARNAVPNAQRPTPAPSGPALTSFVITCRVNAKHPDLIAASAVMPAPAKSANASLSSTNKAARSHPASEQAQAETRNEESDTGEENAD
jgi:Tfp pilus assembly PilM family ATPase/Tfp pilus assembly protein PilN